MGRPRCYLLRRAMSTNEAHSHQDDHVRLQGGDGVMRVFCERCDAAKEIELPLPISEVNDAVLGFIRAHQGCVKI